ncbi:two pore domain potassium channel family protein [Pseudomonas sp. PDM16]|uniref:potassium channel family protein n=1 Tax=Pseudomonas sp. PDM16 TaxID=2769292 RepID=UPI00177E9E18|nr:potassium channel family protein [Pseudomonas sp. PDM16]MBD9414880.1 two pore domain potassium channel family protein [Pseudomonas sp. PDM16]
MSPITYIRRHPSAGLLFVQLLGVLLYPWMEGTQIGRALFGAFGVLVLGMALHVVKRSPAQAWVAGLLAVLVIGLTLLDVLTPSLLLEALISALEAAFYFYAAASLIAYMSADLHASTDELYAVGATFTLLAWAFAHLFTFCQLLAPGSFGAPVEPEAARTWMELLFLSFTTLSGVGLSDITPLTPVARSLVMIEQFAGVMYLALVVSRLIAMTVARR